jgi:hypothetical protein
MSSICSHFLTVLLLDGQLCWILTIGRRYWTPCGPRGGVQPLLSGAVDLLHCVIWNHTSCEAFIEIQLKYNYLPCEICRIETRSVNVQIIKLRAIVDTSGGIGLGGVLLNLFYPVPLCYPHVFPS